MCLSNIKEINLKQDDGFVVMKYEIKAKKAHARWGSEIYKKNKKYEAENSEGSRARVFGYAPGFHYFLTLSDAIRYAEFDSKWYSDYYKIKIYKARFYHSYIEGIVYGDNLPARVAKFRVLKSEVEIGKR